VLAFEEAAEGVPPRRAALCLYNAALAGASLASRARNRDGTSSWLQQPSARSVERSCCSRDGARRRRHSKCFISAGRQPSAPSNDRRRSRISSPGGQCAPRRAEATARRPTRLAGVRQCSPARPRDTDGEKVETLKTLGPNRGNSVKPPNLPGNACSVCVIQCGKLSVR